MKNFFGVPPSPQNAVDLFAGDWTSCLPPEAGVVTAGKTPLHGDNRVDWALQQLGGVQDKRVLEIGPLEAAHTYMLEKAGAREIISVEANGAAWLRCLVVKELAHLQRARFVLGDAVRYLEQPGPRFDFGLACGVLYHLIEPLRFLRLMAERCDTFFIWTVLYDPAWVAAHPEYAHKFGRPHPAEEAGFACNLRVFAYAEALNWSGFCGGGESHALWLTKADLLRAVRHFGCEVVASRDEDHPFSPAIWLALRRR